MVNSLFFDITELATLDKGTGIQRVTKAILYNLSKYPPLGWKVVPIKGDVTSGKYLRACSYESSLHKLSYSEPADVVIEPSKGDIYLSVDLTYNISESLRKELVHFRNNGVGIYFVVHDLIPILYPEWFKGNNDWFEGNNYLDLFNYWFESAATEADGLICVSKSVELDVQNWLVNHPPLRPELPTLGYFHHGSDISASIPTAGLPDNSSAILSKVKALTSFLMVGTIEPRKGHELALNAFDILWANDPSVSLVIVGHQGWKVESLIQRIKLHPQFDKRLFWLADISDEFLREIYKSSSALIALSKAEGFGLPLVEAAYFHLPIIANDIPVFREVCGAGALYFNGTTGHEFSLLLNKWLSLFKIGTYPDSQNIQTLSWAASTRQLMTVLGGMSGHKFIWTN